MMSSDKNESQETLPVLNQEIPVERKNLSQTSLLFYPENPRIYSIVRADEVEPDQDEVFRRLSQQEHVKQLVQDIKLHGGLLDPVIVRGGTMHVLEGNSRLAAYRILAKTDPIKWGRIKCIVLPRDTDESVIFAILTQYHIKGKKDWAPFEQAGFLYRRHKVESIPPADLAKEMKLGPETVKNMIETYQFMIDHGQDDISKWSYYFEFIRSRKIAKVRKTNASIDKLIVKKIKSGEIERAVDVRDELPKICEGPTRTLNSFLDGAIDFSAAVERANAAGGDNNELRRVGKFKDWITSDNAERALSRAELRQMKKIVSDLSKILARCKVLVPRLKRKIPKK
jgi:hypothetical protein